MVAGILAGCGTVALDPPADEAPLFRQIEARIGTVFSGSVHTAVPTNPIARVELGKASIARFEQAFSSMFAQAIQLPDWPPWRENKLTVDGVMEVELEEAVIPWSKQTANTRTVDAALVFRVCLYDSTGTMVQCWKPASRQSYQREELDCLDGRECIRLMMNSALREAVARFIVEAGNDPALRDWASRIRVLGVAP